ncbi:Phosphoglycolate phosphatase [Rhodospirillaceae bacterium LM-1]|nr:Phosphoglycolate phosphatase [Rhodospirillaceae bacterium LM-1]
MQILALLFDLDGTLVDSLPDLSHALNLQLAEEGLRSLEQAEVRLMIGDGAKKLVERAFGAAGRAPLADIEAKVSRFLELYEESPAQRTTVYHGVVETLSALKEKGLKLAVVTNKPQEATERVLAGLELGGLFDAVVGAGRTKALKPDPAPLLFALEKLGVGKEQAVMVGDNANDVDAAKALNIPVVAVTYGYARTAPESLGADLLIESMSDLPTALRWFSAR